MKILCNCTLEMVATCGENVNNAPVLQLLGHYKRGHYIEGTLHEYVSGHQVFIETHSHTHLVTPLPLNSRIYFLALDNDV